jgi:radical SAM protein with 4Fe4S-binding SPASM domain
MDLHNVDDLFNLSNFLLEKFKDYKNYYITPYLLYENNNLPKKPYERDLLNERRLQLKQFLEEKIRFKNEYARVMKYINHCMADTNTSIMILPDGKLGKCEHYIDSGFVGDIYNGITDIKIFNSYKKMSTPLEKCDQCELRPICIYLACCPNVKRYCSEYEKNVKIQELDNYIYSVYNYKKEKNNDV